MLHMIGSTVNRNGPTEANSTPKAEGLRMPEGTVSPRTLLRCGITALMAAPMAARLTACGNSSTTAGGKTVTLRVSSSQPGGAANNTHTAIFNKLKELAEAKTEGREAAVLLRQPAGGGGADREADVAGDRGHGDHLALGQAVSLISSALSTSAFSSLHRSGPNV